MPRVRMALFRGVEPTNLQWAYLLIPYLRYSELGNFQGARCPSSSQQRIAQPPTPSVRFKPTDQPGLTGWIQPHVDLDNSQPVTTPRRQSRLQYFLRCRLCPLWSQLTGADLPCCARGVGPVKSEPALLVTVTKDSGWTVISRHTAKASSFSTGANWLLPNASGRFKRILASPPLSPEYIKYSCFGPAWLIWYFRHRLVSRKL